MLDPANTLYYRNGRIPILAQATVRMQSAAYNQAGYGPAPGLATTGYRLPHPHQCQRLPATPAPMPTIVGRQAASRNNRQETTVYCKRPVNPP